MAKIQLDSLIPHGKVAVRTQDGVLELKTQSSITSIAYNLSGNSYKRHYLELPERAHIPFSLTMRLKLDYSGLIFLIGDGHLLFNCPSNRPIEDPIKPTGKAFPDGKQFNNRLPLNEFVTVKISYGLREMQVTVDGKEAFYTNKLPYVKAKELSQANAEGLRIGFEVAKLSTLFVKEIDLSEADCKLERTEEYRKADKALDCESADKSVKATFDSFVESFPQSVKSEIVETDAFLKAQKTLKMKRTVDPKGDKLTYTASDFGVSYIIRRACGEAWQSFSFYVVTAGKAETWHRVADYMEEMLNEIAKTDRALAERIFFALNDCVGCYGARCIVKTLYEFQNKKKLACHGVVMLRLCREDFSDVRAFFGHLNALVKKKSAEGTLQTDKISLLKK